MIFNTHTEFEFTRFILALSLLLSLSLILGFYLSKFKIPRMFGEIGAGILLGPAILGNFLPYFYEWMHVSLDFTQKILSTFYWLGLIFLMLNTGLNLYQSGSKVNFKIIFFLLLSVTGPTAFVGWLIAEFFYTDTSVSKLSFTLVFIIASSVTSIPVLSRIFLDLKLIGSKFAKNVLISAAIQDSILFALLSIAISINIKNAQMNIDEINYIKTFMIVIIYIAFMLMIVPRVVKKIPFNIFCQFTDSSMIGLALVTCFICIGLGGFFGVNVVFSALVTGVLFSIISGNRLKIALKNIQELSAWFFIPIYFSLVGFQVAFVEDFSLSFAFLFLIISSLVKVISIIFFMRLAGITWHEALDYGLSMNARGGPGIVVASVAYGAEIISANFFNAMIITSILTSLMAGVWLRRRANLIMELN